MSSPAESSPAESSSTGRRSAGGVMMSASSSSSSSSHPTSTRPPGTATNSPHPINTTDLSDPFDNTSTFAEDPFAQPSSSSSSGEDDSHTQNPALQPQFHYRYPMTAMTVDAQRGSVMMVPHQYRSTTDPLLHEGQPIDAEFSSAGPPIEGYDFETTAEEAHPVPPGFTRTFSAPLPNRVGFLRHPLSPVHDPLQSYSAHPPRSSFSAFPPPSDTPPLVDSHSSSTSTAVSSNTSDRVVSPLEILSLELADSVQSAIQTLLHLSPPHLLDNAKEQYSGCTVQMPTTSLTALLTSMRSLNYLSANVVAFCQGLENGKDDGLLAGPPSKKTEDFDVGELLQNVADLLSGQASARGVDLVLFHGDVGIKHISVNGDGEGLGYLLSYIVRQILLVAHKGDTIELGLQIIPQSPSATPRVALPLTAADVDRHRRSSQSAERRSSSPGRTLPSLPSGQVGGPLLCVIEIVHNICQSPDSAAATPKAELNPFTRLAEQREAEKPKLDTLFCRRLLQHQNASLRTDAQPSSPLGSGLPRRAFELSVLLPRGKPFVEPPQLSIEEEAIRQPFATLRLAREPTLSELSDFTESLRGKKVFLHANLTSVFARHLTSYLAAWGMDISHIPIEEGDGYGQTEQSFTRQDATATTPATELVPGMSGLTLSPPGSSTGGKVPDKFIIIDDDVTVLRRELIRIRAEASPMAFKPRLTKRPTLSSRARSTPHVRQVSAGSTRASAPVLIHFTSLANYNQVRDVVSNHLGAPWATGVGTFIHPEVMVVPKPVGPRRFLTALHTAVNQPMVDPFFSPIATSPRSPGGGFFASIRTPTGSELGRDSGFFDTVAEETAEEGRPSPETAIKPRSPLGEYPPSQAHIVRTEAGLHLSLPTPGEIVATPASEYFSNATSSRPGSSGASGVVMQSPDGRPFGMFFEPPIKDRRGSYSQRQVSESARRKPSTRRTSVGVPVDEMGHASPVQSPQNNRRSSGMSQVTNETEDSSGASRRGSGAGIPGEAGSLGRSSRRKTLPASNTDPLIAIGRDRSATLTQANKQRSAGASPGIPSPIAAETPPSAPAPPRHRRATSAQTVITLEDRIDGKAGGKPKKPKDDVVVPPINVLIVEDNPINQNILSMFLRKKKIKYQTAKDGLEAVEKWRTGGFHLILMDIQLPVMNGIEATKEIRRLEKNGNIGVFPSTPSSEITRPVTMSDAVSGTASPFRSSVIIVALTASNLQSDRVLALAAGCNDFLTKPVSLKWLERKIVEWGCMQALIDFDGWRRWKRSDPIDSSETKRGFQVGPQAAARNLAGRLRIDRTKSSRASAPGPDIHVQSATPPIPAAKVEEPVLDTTVAAQSLEEAREELQVMLPRTSTETDVPPALPPADAASSPPSLEAIHEEHENANSPLVRARQGLPTAGVVDKPLPQLPRE
ncbi:hypothetical protein BCR39DRAFT_550166 [Naematelia encephala]|uniref:Response regulatory domain-containing protein n=1 Tax=Naematelia encephala TaxID=71784 RepID=A0A1Y2AL94_9TREE|nr:hypothetical protein BCR39DRAFT_550166 [Naematelia encephala]